MMLRRHKLAHTSGGCDYVFPMYSQKMKATNEESEQLYPEAVVWRRNIR